MNFISRQHIIK